MLLSLIKKKLDARSVPKIEYTSRLKGVCPNTKPTLKSEIIEKYRDFGDRPKNLLYLYIPLQDSIWRLYFPNKARKH